MTTEFTVRNIVGVNVIAEFTREGSLIPMAVRWSDGRIYDIEKVISTNRCLGAMSGKSSNRYRVQIGGQERFLFYESNNRWFIEDQRHTNPVVC